MRGNSGYAATTSVLFVTLLLSSVAQADLINGGFETGTLYSWTLTGSGTAQTSAPLGITPTHDLYYGYIENTGNTTALAPAVAAALGVPGSAIAGLGAGAPTTGSSIQQPVSVAAGEILRFDFNFLSDELNESATFNDFAFYTINSSAFLLGSRNTSTWDPVSPPPGFDGQTHWATQTYTFPSAGTYTVGFGVFNVGDAGHNSVLLLDGIAVPEPGCGGMLALSAIAMLRRRQR